MKPLPKIGPYAIDVAALSGLAHRYDPKACSRTDCCCARYEVAIAPGELERLRSYVPLAARYLAELDPAADPFKLAANGQWVIDKGKAALCRFGYRTPEGITRCAIHAAALEAGRDPWTAKPRVCALWPLAATGSAKGSLLTVAGDAYEFACNERRRRPSPLFDPGVLELVERVFGAVFRGEMIERCEAFIARGQRDRRSRSGRRG